MKIIVRSERREDYPGISEINDLAFGRVNEGKLVSEIRENPKFSSELSLVALVRDQLVGHILFFPIEIQNGDQCTTSLSLAPLAVHPDFQRKGVGSELTRAGLVKAKELGYRSVVVVGHPGYYPRFGFGKASFWKIRLPIEAPDEAVMAIELVKGSLDQAEGVVIFPKEYDIAL